MHLTSQLWYSFNFEKYSRDYEIKLQLLDQNAIKKNLVPVTIVIKSYNSQKN